MISTCGYSLAPVLINSAIATMNVTHVPLGKQCCRADTTRLHSSVRTRSRSLSKRLTPTKNFAAMEPCAFLRGISRTWKNKRRYEAIDDRGIGLIYYRGWYFYMDKE